ncbi:hypothetical protein CEXT_125561 [Caerostris extrusa]|uniref:Uncharacterized protein n=1 Tax=Caerostris extrusa TaxID=172846 RepID=A0AAV4NVD0_CAEEX|nr:hypothetical protein CEXT_125561 [Caerostris extrusa]
MVNRIRRICKVAVEAAPLTVNSLSEKFYKSSFPLSFKLREGRPSGEHVRSTTSETVSNGAVDSLSISRRYATRNPWRSG